MLGGSQKDGVHCQWYGFDPEGQKGQQRPGNNSWWIATISIWQLTIKIYDIIGNEVSILVDGNKSCWKLFSKVLCIESYYCNIYIWKAKQIKLNFLIGYWRVIPDMVLFQ